MAKGESNLHRQLNAPITIWLLSAFALGVFGTTYDEMRNCRSKVERAAVDFSQLNTEIANRRRDLYSVISNAKSMNEIRAAEVVRNWRSQYTFVKYKGRTIKDLEEEHARVGILLSHYPPAIKDMLMERIQRETGNEWVENLDMDRPDFSKLTDSDLTELKQIAKARAKITLKDNGVLFRVVVPKCGVGSSFSRVLFGRPRSVGTFEKIELLQTGKPK